MAKLVGEKITILANEILGTPEESATIKSVYSWGYMVAADSSPDWVGPVDLDGDVLSPF